MGSYNHILDKLKRFTKRYYSKVLVKGVLMFLALGLLFLLFILGFEYFLWLDTTGRLILFVVFLVVEMFLLLRYIVTPLVYLFRLRQGISNKQASLLIGKHFNEVGDKLYNLLDLAEDKDQSELLLASIEQRSDNLRPFAFTKAVDFGDSFKYTKYLVGPLIVIGLIWISGNWGSFFGSADRVVHFNVAYEPPAPFSFKLLSNDLSVLETQAYVIEVTIEGTIRPETAFIYINGVKTLLQAHNGTYRHTLTPPLSNTSFYFEANGVVSKQYKLKALNTPVMEDFSMILDYPDYISKSTEVLKSTGNATLPEGTEVTWEVQGKFIENIKLMAGDTTLQFENFDSIFKLSKKIYSDYPYELTTSNSNVSDYEKLAYSFRVIKDAHPSIKVRQVLDSVNPNTAYFVGQASDDYKLTSIKLVCYTKGSPDEKQRVVLDEPGANYKQFYYTFPSGLELEPGRNYSFYFEATDNDAIHSGKSIKSQVFSMKLFDDDELRIKDLELQQSIIENMGKSVEGFKEQQKKLNRINQEQKEKSQLNFNDQNQIKNFLENQERQEDMMQKFSKQLKDNLEKGQKDSKLNKLLQERLERSELEAKKNKKLLDELNKVAEKINKEELAKRLEELGKKQRNGERSLEQLLELTKRYYVLEKSNQLAKELEKQAERQKILSEIKIEDNLTSKEQQKLNDTFERLSKELNELNNENEDLKKPIDLNVDKNLEKEIKSDQKEAFEELKKHQGSDESSENEVDQKRSDKVKQKQKSAAQNIQKMSEQLSQSAATGGGSASEAEDAEMLRQILDNIVTFSFKQENLYDSLEEADVDVSNFSSTVKRQQELRGLFEHVDDSLFALSLRQAELSEYVNEQITEVYFNIDKSLESMAEGQLYQGASHQKYVLNASNSLADFLVKMLDNMQQSMKIGKGQGEGQDFQLPDIIKGQEELKQKMQGKGNKGDKGQEKSNGSEGEGEKGMGQEQGNKGGSSGEEGKDGKGENGGHEGGNSGKGNGGKFGGQANGLGNDGPNESELKEIYEIYKEQQVLRDKLEEQLKNMINSGDRKLGERLLKQMEDFQNELLKNGVTQQSLDRVNNIQHELLKLENAAMKQGKKRDRESNTNKSEYRNPITTKPELLQNYKNETEILNRQALPLRQNYQFKVKEYFKNDG